MVSFSKSLLHGVSLFNSARYVSQEKVGVSTLYCLSRLVHYKFGSVEMQMNSWYWHMWWIDFQTWCQF
jgi:hypothetical protein